ncbi:MAG: serine/threonine protein kinase [Myxococcota bacterium]
MSTSNGKETMSDELDPRIRIRAPLRCNGIGRLDCAEDADSGMRMAVRWLPLEANGDAAAKAVTQLPAHPTLPAIRRTGRVGSAAYVAMDFPDGRLLSTQLGEPLGVQPLLAVGAHICDALATIHAQGVVHGELSADSVLLTQEKAILWDMPLVIANRLTDRRGEERSMSQLVRTAPFLSPERARGEPASPASDVYALGAVLCLAGGGRPPSASSTLGVVNHIANGGWVPAVPEALPPSARELLSAMVRPDPNSRPSARAAAELFARPLPPAQAEPEPEPPGEQIDLFQRARVAFRKLPTVALAAGAGTLLALISVGALLWGLSSPAPSTAPMVEHPAVTTPSSNEAEEPAPDEETHALAVELLEPLPPPPRPVRAPPKRAKPVVAKKRAPAPAAPKPEDFDFLETNVERPSSELKKMSF